MLGKIFRSKTAAVITTAVVTASVVGGIAYAASSPIDSGGVIHGCYNPTTGAMKLRTGTTCPATGMKTPISWNSQGVQGIQGVPGANGNDGAPGAKGDTGAPGLSGIHRMNDQLVTLLPGDSGYFHQTCPTGEVALSGGYQTSQGTVITDTWPGPADTWNVFASNPGVYNEQLRVWANCAIAAP